MRISNLKTDKVNQRTQALPNWIMSEQNEETSKMVSGVRQQCIINWSQGLIFSRLFTYPLPGILLKRVCFDTLEPFKTVSCDNVPWTRKLITINKFPVMRYSISQLSVPLQAMHNYRGVARGGGGGVPGVLRTPFGLWKLILFQEEKPMRTPLTKFRETRFWSLKKKKRKSISRNASHAIKRKSPSFSLDVVVCFIDIDFSLLQLQYRKAFHLCNLGDDKFKIGYCM